MVMTLLEASKLHSGDVVRSGVIEMFAQTSDILRVLPFIDVAGGAYHYNLEGKLPGVAFRGINEAFAESTGIIAPQVEVLRICGGDLDVDKAILDMHGEDVRTRHELMKIRALSLYLGKKLIKGDSTNDVREFDGLQNRITGSQLVAAGGALSLIKLDEVIDAVDFANYLIMSKAMARLISAAARNTAVGGFVTYDKNEFGRRVMRYNDLPILTVDHDDDGARVLDFNEAATTTSIYAVNFNDGYCVGLQNGVMQVRDRGEIDAKPVYRTRIDWNVGFATMHGRCAARLSGITNAAVVA